MGIGTLGKILFGRPRFEAAARALFPFFLALILVFPLLLLASCGDREEISLVVIPSLKGEIFSDSSEGFRVGGVSLIAGALKKIRDRGGSPIVVAANNTLIGTPEAFFSQGEGVLQILRNLGLRALILDARDVSYGQARLAELSKGPEAFLGANLVKKDGSRLPWAQPYFWDPDTKTAIIGLVGPFFIQRSIEELVAGLTLLDAKETVEKILPELRSLGAKTVGVVALGFRVTPENDSFLWPLAEIEGVTFVLQGDLSGAAAPLETRKRADGSLAVLLRLDADASDKAHTLSYVRYSPRTGVVSHEVLEINEKLVEPDESVKEDLNRIRASTDAILNKVIAVAEDDFPHQDKGESAFGNLVTDLMREHTGTRIALLNSGALREGFRKGGILVRDVFTAMPFDGNLVTCEIEGKTLLAVLKRSLGFLTRPEQGRGFLQVSGLSFDYFLGNEPELRNVRVNGEALEEDRWYSVCTDRFVFTGGDGYVEFGRARAVSTSPRSSVNLFIELFEGAASWKRPAGARIREIGPPDGGGRV